MTYMYNKDKDCIREHDKTLRVINQHANLEKGPKELRKNKRLADHHRYHDIVRVQGAVLAHLRECYSIRYNEARKIKHEAKEEGTPFYLLREDKYCSFPPKPKLDHIIAIKEDEGSDLYD